MNTKEIINGYLGNTQVNRIYQGPKLIWSKYFESKYLICGDFTTCNGITKNKILRLNSDDTVDNTWSNNNYTSGIFNTLAYDNINKKIYAGGAKSLDGGLVRFNLDGTKDTSFNIGSGFNSTVSDINIDTINSKIYVGGGFTIYNGGVANRLVRLNMNGTKDTSFNIGSGFDDGVSDINIDTINSKIYAGGRFTTYNGGGANRLVRLNMDGSRDTSFDIGTGFNRDVYVIQIDNINSKIYAGGNFKTYNGDTQNRLVRLNMDGTKDTSFNIGSGLDRNAYAIKIDNTNSKIYVGGDFTTYNGGGANRLVRLNMNGSRDTSFNIGTGADGDIVTSSGILVDNEKNKIYITGAFTKYNNQEQKYIARLNMDGSLDNTFNIQLDSYVMAILKYTV